MVEGENNRQLAGGGGGERSTGGQEEEGESEGEKSVRAKKEGVRKEMDQQRGREKYTGAGEERQRERVSGQAFSTPGAGNTTQPNRRPGI
jgi:hypothetical protein